MSAQTDLMTAVTELKSASTTGVIGSMIDWIIAAIALTTVLITRVTASMHAWIAHLIVHLTPAGIMFQTVSTAKVIASTAVWTTRAIGSTAGWTIAVIG